MNRKHDLETEEITVIGHRECRIKDDTKIACEGSWCDDGIGWHENIDRGHRF